MKKIFGAVAAVAMMFSGFAFAEGYMNANDLEKGDLTADKEVEDGFVLKANEEKYMAVEKFTGVTVGDEAITQRVSLKGSGKIDYRSISFPAKKGEKITIAANSGSKTEVRPLLLVNEAGEEVGQVACDCFTDGAKPSVETIECPADGTYTVYSKKSGIYVYLIKVGK